MIASLFIQMLLENYVLKWPGEFGSIRLALGRILSLRRSFTTRRYCRQQRLKEWGLTPLLAGFSGHFGECSLETFSRKIRRGISRFWWGRPTIETIGGKAMKSKARATILLVAIGLGVTFAGCSPAPDGPESASPALDTSHFEGIGEVTLDPFRFLADYAKRTSRDVYGGDLNESEFVNLIQALSNLFRRFSHGFLER
jgi:hypothetical protein